MSVSDNSIAQTLEQNKQLVARFLEALGRGKADIIFGSLDPEPSWWIAPSTALGGDYHGMEQVMGMFMKNGMLFKHKSIQWEIQRSIAEGEYVAVECTMRGITASGKDYFNYFHIQFHVVNGLIKGVREYNDSHYSHLQLFEAS